MKMCLKKSARNGRFRKLILGYFYLFFTEAPPIASSKAIGGGIRGQFGLSSAGRDELKNYQIINPIAIGSPNFQIIKNLSSFTLSSFILSSNLEHRSGLCPTQIEPIHTDFHVTASKPIITD